jgi:hypothetical protein
VLGCQACGDGEGVDKRVDVVATLLQKGGTVYDMEEAELCYGEERKGGGRARGGGGGLRDSLVGRQAGNSWVGGGGAGGRGDKEQSRAERVALAGGPVWDTREAECLCGFAQRRVRPQHKTHIVGDSNIAAFPDGCKQ